VASKVLNKLKNERALRECAAPPKKPGPVKPWTVAMVKALRREDGTDTTCPVCGCSAREEMPEGGPNGMKRLGWKWIRGEWRHRCEFPEEP